MRKFKVVLFAGVMACALMACGKTETTETTTEMTTESQTGVDTDINGDNTGDDMGDDGWVDFDNGDTTPVELGDGTPAKMFRDDFKARMDADSSVSLEDLANGLIGNEWVPFMGMTRQVEPGYMNGFTEEITGFTDAWAFEPGIGSIPFVGYVFDVDGDAEAFAENLKAKADLRWNICTAADEMICEVVGNRVFFVMAPATFEE